VVWAPVSSGWPSATARGQIYASAGETPRDGIKEPIRASSAVLLRGLPIAFVQGAALPGPRRPLERTVQVTAEWMSNAWAAAVEIESLVGEIVHTYEELHLLYELGEALTSQLTLTEAADVILERLLHTLPADWAELTFNDGGVDDVQGESSEPMHVRAGLDTPPVAVLPGLGKHRLPATLRSAGQTVGTIVLVRVNGKEPFSSSDEKPLNAVATLAGQAIANARLYDELRRNTDALRNGQAHLRAVLDNVAEGIVTTDEAGVIQTFNAAAERVFGYASSDVVGQHVGLLMPDPSRWRDGDEAAKLSAAAAADSREALGRRKNGSTFPIDLAITEVLRDASCRFILSIRDITDRKQWEQALEHQALHDGLTQLPNRTLLHDRLHQAILSSQRNDRALALLVMDLDGFKEVNDSFGHHCGDLLLQQIGPRLRSVLREADTVARLGGDEFAVLLPGVLATDAVVSARRLLDALERPFTVEGHNLGIGASFGIALLPDHGTDAETLLRRADIAMYVAKRTHAGYALYEPDHDARTPNRLAFVGQLRTALDEDQIVLHYQPLLNLKTGRFDRVEALARWQHPEHGLLPPAQFIPLAEETSLIGPFSHWVLNAALRQCSSWHTDGQLVSVVINLSTHNLHDQCSRVRFRTHSGSGACSRETSRLRSQRAR
jgi:diguanylate cyclase (GGDEF)-like protein/PAS domain S-box-containing protein